MEVDGAVDAAKPGSGLAHAVARQMFVSGERVDMGTLARRLEVGRSTLYRWVGDRETLISDVLADLSRRTWELARANAKGRGLNRAIDVVRGFMTYTSDYLPLREFVQQNSRAFRIESPPQQVDPQPQVRERLLPVLLQRPVVKLDNQRGRRRDNIRFLPIPRV